MGEVTNNQESRLSAALFADGPARDDRFCVVERWCDCENLPVESAQRQLEFLHRQMNEEVDGMECAADSLVEFPDADWQIRMKIARQVSDEARHVCMFKALFVQRGGTVGEYAVLNFQYRIITKLNSLVGRLAVQNRLFEAEGVDAIEPEIEAAHESGDKELAALFESQLADEISHVRYANEYINACIKESPGTVMDVGRAMNQASIAFREVMGQEAIDSATYGTNITGRLEAGFSDQEVDYAVTLRENAKNTPNN